MIQLTVAGSSYSVPTSWRDITYKTYCDIIKFEGSNNDFIALLSGIPSTTLQNVDEKSMLMLSELLIFTTDRSFLDRLNYIPENLEQFSIAREEWNKLEKAKQEIQRHKHYICAAAGIIKIYFGKDITNEPIYKVWGQINFVLSEINKFFEKYKRLSEHEEDADEFQANVKRFEQFGFFAQCVELSRKMGVSYDQVLKMSAGQVYQTFLYDFEKADYEKALYKIRSSRK